MTTFKMTIIKRDRDLDSPTYGKDLYAIPVMDPSASSGVCLLKGFSGLWHAPRTHVKEAWAYQEGVTLSDFPRVDERIMDIRLATKGRTAAEWEDIDSRLWDVLNFQDDAIIRIETTNAKREINCRLERKPADQMDMIPGLVKHMVWAVTLIACDPWWYSSTLISSWTRGSTALSNDGYYHGAVTILNKADQECWLEWANAEIQVAEQWTLPDANAKYAATSPNAGQQVMHPLPTLGPGKSFLVQTHPLRETLMVMDNSLEWAKMKAEEFVSPLPKHTDPVVVPVLLKGGNSASSVSVYMVQRWDRPLGGTKYNYDPIPPEQLYPSPTLFPSSSLYPNATVGS